MGSGIRHTWVRILILAVGCVTCQRSYPLSLWRHSASGPGSGLSEDSVRCCMCGLHIVSQRGCGTGGSMLPGLLIGMTGWPQPQGCTQGFRTRLLDTVPRVPAFRSSRISLASLSSCLLVSLSLSVFLCFFQLLLSLGTLQFCIFHSWTLSLGI